MRKDNMTMADSPKTQTLHVTLEFDLSEHDIAQVAEDADIDLAAATRVVQAMMDQRKFIVDNVRNDNTRLRASIEELEEELKECKFVVNSLRNENTELYTSTEELEEEMERRSGHDCEKCGKPESPLLGPSPLGRLIAETVRSEAEASVRLDREGNGQTWCVDEHKL